MADGNLERVGVEAVAEGVNEFVRQLERMNSAMASVGGASSGAASGASGMTSSFASVGSGAVALGTFVGGLALTIGGTLVNAFQSAVASLTSFGTNALMTAGSFQELEFAALAIGQSMGISQDETRKFISSMNDAGIRTDVAAKTVAQFARNQIDLSKSFDLARIAQATGILVGRDSSETMGSLVHAITTGSTVMLRHMGIFVDNTKVEKEYAASVGKTTEQLTNQEVLQARVNAIIKDSAGIMGVYDAAMESPTKRLRTLASRLLPELSAAVGAPFLSAFSTVVKSISDFVVALSSAVQEGGALYPVMVQLGAVASLIADGFASLVGVATDAISGFSDTFSGGLAAMAEGALRWGAEIVGALAQGFVEGASAVLVPAMQFLGNILASWLAPGSPPKVAPWLPSAGAAAMTEYLKGFSSADFGVLDSLQGVLRSALSGPDFARITQDLIATIGGGGAGRESFFADIAKTAGQFGAQIADLARKQFALADATAAVTKAEREHGAAQKNTEKAQSHVSALTAEYNRMLRGGASKAALAAKLQEIRAAQGGLKLAQKQETQAKENVDSEKAKVDALKEQVSLQDKLVKQLLDMAKATQVISTIPTVAGVAAAGAGAGAGAFAIPTPTMPTGLTAGITAKINEAIDKAKEQLKTKFAGIFSPITDVFKSPAFVNLKTQFSDLWGIIFGRTATRTLGRSATGEMIVEQFNVPGIIDKLSQLSISFSNMIPPTFFADLQKIGNLFGSMAAQLAIGQIITGVAATIAILAAGITTLIGVVGLFDAVFNGIPVLIVGVTTTILATWETFKINFTAKTQEICGQVTSKLNSLEQGVKKIWDGMAKTAIEIWANIKDKIASFLNELIGSVTSFVTLISETLVGGFNTFMTYMAETFGPWIKTFTATFIDPFRGALQFIATAIESVIGAIEELKRKLQSIKLPAALSPGSPTPFEMGMRGIADAMREMSGIELPAMSRGLQAAAPVAARAMGGGQTPAQQIYRQASVSIGPNYVSQSIDAEILWAEIRRRILHEMRTA